MPKKLATLLSIALAMVTVALSVVAINFGAKIVFQSQDFQSTHRNGIRVVEYALKQRADIYGEDSGIIPHPYLLYANRPVFFGEGFQQTDEAGYRIVPQPHRSPGERPKKVLVLGGSTTFSYPYVADPSNAWPSQLQKILGPAFEVTNAGLSSATTAELLAGYFFRHRYLKPDIVIIHEGGNDVLAMMFENYNAEYTHLRGPGTRPVAGPFDKAVLAWGGWPAKLVYAENWDQLTTVFSPLPFDLSRVAPAEALDRATNSPTTGFERNLDLLVRTIIADGATPILFGFVQAREQFISRNRLDLRGRERAWVVGLERNLDIMKRLAADRHLTYLDPHEFKTDDDWFIDNCHLNEVGEAAKAAFVARAYFGYLPLISSRP
jgi:lysophospholipase L1-like esterase